MADVTAQNFRLRSNLKPAWLLGKWQLLHYEAKTQQSQPSLHLQSLADLSLTFFVAHTSVQIYRHFRELLKT